LDDHTVFDGGPCPPPGLTNTASGAADADGLTSYEAFSRFADPRPGMTAVDLACGNGPCVKFWRNTSARRDGFVGVDLSDAELKLRANGSAGSRTCVC
jgi:hypothetical protein